MQTLTILTQLLGSLTEEHDMYVQVVAVITAFAVSAGINTKDVMAVLRKYGYELPGFICAWRAHPRIKEITALINRFPV
ncbi:MAG: Hypothetical protein BHV28_12640 [Candidatus Tokpelaia hoelldobleri]|uniref:Uncharacterized protein n=1 Tax=Candidatus Tokpelaia hoelldobleri TaxID=1902579 RepID=A0A1U9JVR0_9HYPH|nr:MAG: Hypothetical protein BHV28_12640 [Candidatus Tokpelaia hoelldoblerii]